MKKERKIERKQKKKRVRKKGRKKEIRTIYNQCMEMKMISKKSGGLASGLDFLIGSWSWNIKLYLCQAKGQSNGVFFFSEWAWAGIFTGSLSLHINGRYNQRGEKTYVIMQRRASKVDRINTSLISFWIIGIV